MLPSIIDRAAREYGDHPAYETHQGWTLSYAELARSSDELAVGLARRGIGFGDFVMLALPSVVDYIVAFGAVARLGAITAGVNPGLTASERNRVIEAGGPDLVLASPALADGMIAEVEAEIVELGDHPDAVFDRLRVRGESVPVLPDDLDRPACVCFTSGSTGVPKGVLFTNRQLDAVANIDTGRAWGGGTHALSSTQFAHVGLMTKLPWQLASGQTMHLQERWRARWVLEAIDRYRMPVVAAVAPQLALMLRDPDLDRFDFSCVQAIIAGAGPSPPALVNEARQVFGAGYSIRYSSTECGGVALGTALDADDDEALYTVGRPRPPVEACVRDPDGRELGIGEVGEICLRSPAVMAGYWRNPEATEAAFHDGGWLRTGDLAFVDERGLYHLAGRIKEMFIRGGYNVYPLEVEAVLGTHPLVAEVAVIARPDPVMGEIGVAVVVAADADHPPSLDDLRSHGERGLARYKLPEALRLVDEIPRNSGYKIDRKALEAADRA